MALIKDGILTIDNFHKTVGHAELPVIGDVLVNLNQWNQHKGLLLSSHQSVGVLLQSNEHPKAIANDIKHFDLIALEFPVFRDGRPYSYAKLLRERYRFSGELRAVGEVLLDQLYFMDRVGFNSFEFNSENPLLAWRKALDELNICYQPSADTRITTSELRNTKRDLKLPLLSLDPLESKNGG